MKKRADSHPFDQLVQRFAELVAIHLNRAVAHAPSVPAAAAPKAAAAKPRAARPRPGNKRAPALIEQATSRLLAHIKSHRGLRIEEIARDLGTSTRELKLPAQKLLAGNKVKTKGLKRATRYYPA